MKCEYCENPHPSEETYVCASCSKLTTNNPDNLLIESLQDLLTITQNQRNELATLSWRYTIAVASLRSDLYDLFRKPNARTLEEWVEVLQRGYQLCELPRDLSDFHDRFRQRNINKDDYRDRGGVID